MDFFKDDDVFIACGTERMSIDDFYLDSEGTFLLILSSLVYLNRAKVVGPNTDWSARIVLFFRVPVSLFVEGSAGFH